MNDIIKHKYYFATIHFSIEDEVLYSKVLGIADLVIFEGLSVLELKKAYKEAIDDYRETCNETGKIPEKNV